MLISTAALIRDGDRLLLVRRPPGGDLGGKWELPGGKVDPGETPQEALSRELAEELSIDSVIGKQVGTARFEHGGKEFQLRGYEVTTDISGIVLREHVDMRWSTIAGAVDLDLAPSDRSLLNSLAQGA